MLTLFPDILFLAPLAVALLRVVAGLNFLYIAYRLIVTREEIGRLRAPIIGRMRSWKIWFAAVCTFIVGALLIVGLWTQAVAIIGFLIATKHLVGTKMYPDVLPLSAGANLWLSIVCVALTVMGAGVYGIDLPL